MDRNQNRITSVTQFRQELQGLLERARKNLVKDKGLGNVALLSGYPVSKQLLLYDCASELVSARLKSEVRHASYESVAFIALAAVATKGSDDGEPLYRPTTSMKDLGVPLTEAAWCIVVEGSHRDFGNHATHVEFRQGDDKDFVFGRTGCGALSGGVLAGLWPKKSLNA